MIYSIVKLKEEIDRLDVIIAKQDICITEKNKEIEHLRQTIGSEREKNRKYITEIQQKDGLIREW